MFRFTSKILYYFSGFLACTMMAFTTGCASGGFKLTRQYAGWVNSQQIVLRVILYILTGIVFAVTLLVDFVIFNTMDFWEGRISEGTYDFHHKDRTYYVQHEYLPGTRLKRSTIKIVDSNKKLMQEVVLRETPSGEIEMLIDGGLRTRVRDLKSIPVATMYDSSGKMLEDKVLWFLPSAPERIIATNN